MQRYSDAFNIRKTDIGKSVIKKTYKELTEWWIYREREGRFVDLTGQKMKTGDRYLYCVIACEGNYGIRQENEEFIAVEGMKFTDDECGDDLTDYLHKTGGRGK